MSRRHQKKYNPHRQQKPRFSPEEQAVRDRVKKIADILGEGEPRALSQIRYILNKRGVDFIKSRLREAKSIQDGGGMKVDDGRRKKTFGGVFFYLVKLHWHRGVRMEDIDEL